ncbi:11980_t:CDS:2, partial [Funneliformis geosporum]
KSCELNPLTIMQIMSDYRGEKKIGNKATSNEKNITVVTELGKIDIMTAIRQDRLSNRDFYYYCENNYSFVIAEIITVFEKRGSSYVRIDLLTGLNEGKIHARLYDLKSDSACEFTPIINQNCIQFICESSSFHFVAYLGSVSEEYHGASHWLGKMIKLCDLQYATFSFC